MTSKMRSGSGRLSLICIVIWTTVVVVLLPSSTQILSGVQAQDEGKLALPIAKDCRDSKCFTPSKFHWIQFFNITVVRTQTRGGFMNVLRIQAPLRENTERRDRRIFWALSIVLSIHVFPTDFFFDSWNIFLFLVRLDIHILLRRHSKPADETIQSGHFEWRWILNHKKEYSINHDHVTFHTLGCYQKVEGTLGNTNILSGMCNMWGHAHATLICVTPWVSLALRFFFHGFYWRNDGWHPTTGP